MKIIDLLNKIANGEEVPKKIKYGIYYWEYDKEIKDYKDNDDDYVFSCSNYDIIDMLNKEVEIIEEKEMCHKCHKYPAEYNQTYCEFCLGISKLEKHKIPEKIDLSDWIEITSLEDTKYKALERIFNKNCCCFVDKINEILDYLEEIE